MGRNLDDVVCSVGVRLGEVGDDDFIDTFRRALLGLDGPGIRPDTKIGGFNQFSEHGVAGFEIALQPQHWQRNIFGIRARGTDYANASSTGRSSDRDDCVVEVHGKIVAVLFWTAATDKLTVDRAAQAWSLVCSSSDRQPGNDGRLRPDSRCE